VLADEAQSDRWELSAIESLVLLNGPMTSEVTAVSTAILELVVRRALMLMATERRVLFIFKRFEDRVSPGPTFHNEYPEPLKEVLRRYRGRTPAMSRGRDSSVRVQDLAASLFGSERSRGLFHRVLRREVVPVSGGFVESVMMPHLSKLGLFRWSANSQPGGFRFESWEITPLGVEKLDRLGAILAEGRESFSIRVYQDPDRAAQLVGQAGAAILLIPGIAPSIRVLHSRISGQSTPVPPPSGRWVKAAPSRMVTAPVNAFSVAALAGVFGPGELDGFDSAFHAISETAARAWSALIDSGGFWGG